MKVKLEPWAYTPLRAHRTDAGLDLRTPIGFVLEPHTAVVIDTGVHVQLPINSAGLLVSKSGLNVNNSITSTGLIDEGYTGSIKIKLYNHGNEEKEFTKGDKISQLVIIHVRYEGVELVDEIEGGERADAGFGSTGK